MTRKHLLLVLAAALATMVAAGAAFASPSTSHASLLIRHQVHGCHAWSVNGNAFKASQSISLKRGSSLTLTNNDVMPHTLVETSGPKLAFAPASLKHMGATVSFAFQHPGVYHFTTKPGEDYPGMSNLKTIGEDNVLRLTVTVP